MIKEAGVSPFLKTKKYSDLVSVEIFFKPILFDYLGCLHDGLLRSLKCCCYVKKEVRTLR